MRLMCDTYAAAGRYYYSSDCELACSSEEAASQHIALYVETSHCVIIYPAT
jgi:hypothetical protein